MWEFQKDATMTFKRSGGKKLSIAQSQFDDPRDYFWFEALEAGSTVTLSGANPVSVEYSVDGKHTWQSHIWEDGSNTYTLAEVGDRVYFRGSEGTWSRQTSSSFESYIYRNSFKGTGKLKTGGELLALLGKDKEMTTNCCFWGLFYYNSALVDASELILAPNLTPGCYMDMFYRCTELVYGPQFKCMDPGTAPQYCYHSMFYECNKLTTTPSILPAMTVEKQAYNSMFYNCRKIVSAPLLPATTIADGCYFSMFSGCSKLASFQEELPSMIVYKSSYSGMFGNCTSLKTAPRLPATTLVGLQNYYHMFAGSGILDVPELPATTLAKSCYDGMFQDCDGLTEVNITLPATTVPEYAYRDMFLYCSNLTKAPEINAETLTGGYSMKAMFAACPSLVTGPSVLKPQTLSQQAYYQMFAGDAALATAPVIMAEDISASQCMMYMFSGCSVLDHIEVRFSDWGSSTSSTQYWVSQDTYNQTGTTYHKYSGVAATGKFYKPVGLAATVNSVGTQNYIPQGWEIYNLEEVGADI